MKKINVNLNDASKLAWQQDDINFIESQTELVASSFAKEFGGGLDKFIITGLNVTVTQSQGNNVYALQDGMCYFNGTILHTLHNSNDRLIIVDPADIPEVYQRAVIISKNVSQGSSSERSNRRFKTASGIVETRDRYAGTYCTLAVVDARTIFTGQTLFADGKGIANRLTGFEEIDLSPYYTPDWDCGNLRCFRRGRELIFQGYAKTVSGGSESKIILAGLKYYPHNTSANIFNVYWDSENLEPIHAASEINLGGYSVIWDIDES